VNAVGGSLGGDQSQLGDLLRYRGHNQLAAAAMRQFPLRQVLVEHLLALDAQTRLVRALGVVDPGVDYLAVA
jgi:hypothetical protein